MSVNKLLGKDIFITSTTNASGTTVGSITTLGGININQTALVSGALTSTANSNTIGNIFTTDGNVGFGTTSPVQRLDVNGNLNITGNFYQNGSVYSGSTQWGSTGANIYFNTGNVGIGTISPGYTLDVRTTTSGAYTYTGNFLSPNITASQQSGIVIGKANSANNVCEIRHFHASDGSNQNMLRIGSSGLDNIMCIRYDGYVGIGTTSPSYKLQIAQDSTSNSPSQIVISGVTNPNQQLLIGYNTAKNIASIQPIIQSTGFQNFALCHEGGNVGIRTTSPLYTLDVNGTLEASNSNGLMLFASSGNVGIGTTSPRAFLHFGSTTVSPRIMLFGTDTTSAYHGIAQGNSSLQITVPSSGSHFIAFGSNTGGNFSEQMRIQNNGNVGIGTTSPGRQLTLSGLSISELMFESRSATTDSKRWVFGTNNTIFYGYSVNDANNATSNWLQVNRSALSISSTCFPNGNVGIGTTSPTGALHITGNTGDGTITGTNTLVLRSKTHAHPPSIVFDSVGENTGISLTTTRIVCNDNGSSGSNLRFLTNNTDRVVILHNGNVGIGTVSPIYQFQISADSAGKPNGGSWSNSSDQRLKENIELADLNLCYNIIKTLPLKRYKWKDNSYTDDQIKDRNVVGWIAQDVISIFPKAVEEKPFTQVDGTIIEDCLTLNETMINRTLYGAVQQLIRKNEIQETELQTTINTLNAEISAHIATQQRLDTIESRLSMLERNV